MADLYGILGVARTASVAEIKAAYHAKAKETHPDMPGGSADAFAAAQGAYEVLSDPGRRASYDTNGQIEDKRIDDLTTRALGIIEHMLRQTVAQLSDGPIYVDIVQKMRDASAESRTNLADNMAQCSAKAQRLRKFAKRFSSSGKNYLADMIEYQAGQEEQRLDQMQKALDVHDRAVEILKDFSFEADKQDPETAFYSMLSQQARAAGTSGLFGIPR